MPLEQQTAWAGHDMMGYHTESEPFNRLIKKNEADRPRMEDCAGVYSQDIIKWDKAGVARIKSSSAYEVGRTEAAIVAEQGVFEQIGDEQILGDADATLASEFDDLMRGVDLVVRFEPEEGKQPSYLAIDIKTNLGGRDNDEKVRRSIESSVDEAKNNGLREIKYYVDPQSGGKGRIFAPRVVLIFDSRYILTVRDAIAKPSKQRTPRENMAIAEFQLKIKSQIVERCEEMASEVDKLIASNANVEKTKIVRLYSECGRRVRETMI
ncbi:MAG: hypothetical protein V1763_01830 [Parcubacteria group bacterium]